MTFEAFVDIHAIQGPRHTLSAGFKLHHHFTALPDYLMCSCLLSATTMACVVSIVSGLRADCAPDFKPLRIAFLVDA